MVIIIIIIISNNNSCHLCIFVIVNKTVDYFTGKLVSHKKDELNHILDQFNIQVRSLKSLTITFNNMFKLFISVKVS